MGRSPFETLEKHALPGRERGEDGITLIEVTLALALLAFALVGVASSLGTNASAMGQARGLTHATHFVDEVLDSIAAQPYETLGSLNGNVLYDQPVPRVARYRIRLTVSEAALDLQQVRVVLMDNRTGNEITRLVTYRSRR